MKLRLRAVAALVVALLLAGCASASPQTSQSAAQGTQPATEAAVSPAATQASVGEVAALKGPTSMGLAQLAAGGKYQLSLHGTADEVTPGLVKGETKLAAIPANLAAVLYAKGAKIKVAAVNTLGVLYVVAKGTSIDSLAALEGKKVYSTGKGTTPQYVLEYLLEQNGLTGKVNVEYLSEASEVATRVAAEKEALAVLPEPYVTTLTAKDPSITAAIDLTEEWQRVSSEVLVTGVLVAADDVDDAELGSFLADYRASIESTNADPAAAAGLIAELGIVPSAEVAEAAIPRCHLAFLSGAEAKAAISAYLNVLFEANPESVGGSLPGDDFYYAA
jgi:NitT/TauT family transport system substrate-binding protein